MSDVLMKQLDNAHRLLDHARREMEIAEENMARCQLQLREAYELVAHWEKYFQANPRGVE